MCCLCLCLCHQQILGFKIPLNKILFSKQNVLLRRCESEAWKFGFIKGVDKDRITTMKDFESWLFEALPFVRANDQGLTLETLAFQIFLGGNSTWTNLFDKTKFSSLKFLCRFSLRPGGGAANCWKNQFLRAQSQWVRDLRAKLCNFYTVEIWPLSPCLTSNFRVSLLQPRGIVVSLITKPCPYLEAFLTTSLETCK